MRLSRLIVPLVAAAVFVTLSSTSAEAASVLRFSYAQYDSPGTDTGSNASRNAEFVRVKNFSTTTRDLSGWRISDAQGHVYTFPAGSKVGPGKYVNVHTGSGTDTALNRYWRQAAYIWNNTGDTARLRTPGGVLKDSCAWGDGDGTTTC